MRQYSLREAKARLSEILDAVAVVLRKGGKGDRFRNLLLEGAGAVRRPGALKGQLTVPDDFNREEPELTAAFEG